MNRKIKFFAPGLAAAVLAVPGMLAGNFGLPAAFKEKVIPKLAEKVAAAAAELTPLDTPVPPTPTLSFTASPVVSPTPSSTGTPTPTPSATPTLSPSFSATMSFTQTRSSTFSPTPTPSPTESLTHTFTPSSSSTPSVTQTMSATPSATQSPTITPTLTPTLPSFNLVTNVGGIINTFASFAGSTFIGGNFSYLGPETGYGFAWDIGGAALDTTWAKVNNINLGSNGRIDAVLPDGSGGWYLGGFFNRAGGVNQSFVVKIKPDKTIDTAFNAQANGNVTDMALVGGSLFVVGQFTSMGGLSRSNVAKLNASTGAGDPTFNPAAPDNLVWAVAADATSVYIGGDFTFVGAQNRNKLARLNAGTGAVDLAFVTASARVRDLELSGASLYAAGDFSSIGGITRSYIAKLDASTGAGDAGFNAATSDGPVYKILLNGADLYVGGNFDNMGGLARADVAKLNAASGAGQAAFNAGISGAGEQVDGLALDGSQLYVGGQLNAVGGQARTHLARVDSGSGAVDASFNVALNSRVKALALGGGAVYVGGLFTSAGGKLRYNLAKVFDNTGVIFDTFTPYAVGPVNKIMEQGGSLYIQGPTYVSGVTSTGVVKVNPVNGVVDTAFAPVLNGGGVVDIATDGVGLFICGTFNGVSGTTRQGIAKIDLATGALIPAFNSAGTLLGAVNTLHYTGSELYAGGSFTMINGVSRDRIALFDPGSAAVGPLFNPGANNTVFRIKSQGAQIYAMGNFTQIGGQNISYLARMDNGGVVDTAFNANLGGPPNDLAFSGSSVYAAGNLLNPGGPTWRGMAKLSNANGAHDSSFNLGLNLNVNAIGHFGESFYLGGQFFWINNEERNSLARVRVVDGALN